MTPPETTAATSGNGNLEPVYQVSIDGNTLGPLPLSEVVEGMLSGRFSPDLWIWEAGWPEWRQLREVFPDCVPLPAAHPGVPAAAASSSLPPATRDPGLLSALAYPLAGDGAIMLAAGTVFFTLLIGGTMLAPRASILLGVFSFGYLLVALQHIVQTSAYGEPRMPAWPAFESATWFDELLHPCLLWTGTLALCLGPGYAVLSFYADAGDTTVIGFGWVLLIGGAVYLPMALLAVAMTDSLGGLDPRLVIPSILAIPGRYLLALVLLGVMTAMGQAVHAGLDRLHLGWLAALPNGFVTLYIAVVQARLLGLIYHTNRDRFRWS
jgi:hypothetical protein